MNELEKCGNVSWFNFGYHSVFFRGVKVKVMGEERGCVGSCWGKWREGDHCGDLGVDGFVILGLISRRWDVGIWTGLGWPRIGTVGGRL